MQNSDDAERRDEVVRFDDSLPVFVELMTSMEGAESVGRAAFIRDARGALAVVLDRELDDDEREKLVERAKSRLGGYARGEKVVRGVDDLSARRLLREAMEWPKVYVPAVGGALKSLPEVHLIDRRVVGVDWLAQPSEIAEDVPRVAFISIKGGVGRSTALAVCAAHLARSGQRVLAVDLDLEAPGLGSILLDDETCPQYGAVDWLVENGLSGIDDLFRADAIGASPIARGVSVLPAFGTATHANPSDALAKIARAAVEDFGKDGPIPFRTQVRRMLDACANSGDYDVILIDGRAGLHETTAAVALSSGARVLFFGRDEPQTYQGYKLLLAHLDERVCGGGKLRERAWFVHARAISGDTTEAIERFQNLWTRASKVDDGLLEGAKLGPDDFDVSWPSEADAATVPVPDDDMPVLKIMEDTRYYGFDPLRDESSLEQAVYTTTFGSIIDWLEEEVLGRVGNLR